jgi:ATP-dependent DNA helicase RecG
VALEEVKRDLRHPSPMLRVLDGEVGAGKSLVALLAAVMVAEAKEQVLISAPTPGIAAARFLFMEPLLRELGLVARLFTDAPSRAQIDALRRGEVHVAFGTADMIDPKVTFRRLGLVVAEERGSFGSASTRVRALRSPRPDLLVLPAVPLTTAQLLGPFSDHDVSWMPRGSAPLCEVEILGAAERSSAYAALAQTVANRRQGLVVFPRVRDTDVLDERAAARVVAAMEQQAVPGARVQLLHGSLSREEAFRVFSDFRHHRFDVLVSTVSVQEGPVVPQVDLVVVEQADHMDAVELRRVRGYVAREGARCLMVCGESPAPGAVQRLEQVRDHAGRQLSELFDGDQARCGWLDSDRDHDVLLAARRFAHARLRADPGLRSADSAELARWLIWRWPALSEDACPVPEPLAPSRRPRRRRRRRR